MLPFAIFSLVGIKMKAIGLTDALCDRTWKPNPESDITVTQGLCREGLFHDTVELILEKKEPDDLVYSFDISLMSSR